MTDKEYLAALRHCYSYDGCGACPLEQGSEECDKIALPETLKRMEALIAENEHLREVTKMMPGAEGERVSKCESCKHHNTDEGWAFCDTCIHCQELKDMYHPISNADHIRGMTDEELAKLLWKLDSRELGEVTNFCKDSGACDGLPVEEIAEGMCKQCLLNWLRQPWESPAGEKG